VFVFAVVIGLAVVGLVWALRDKQIPIRRGEEKPSKTIGVASDSQSGWADDNVRAVQMKLRDGGLYSGEIDGAYSSELVTALTRYQIRNGLPITGQLDVDTSKALGAKPAVTTAAKDRAQSSEVWRRLRKGEQETMAATDARERLSPGADQSRPETAAESSSAVNVTTERLRDYVGAFVLAGLDPRVGAEADFFADRVEYYDQGLLGREKIRQDLERYAARWPERRFWLAGDVTVEPQNGNRVRVTFPLRYELRKGGKHSSGRIDKTLVLELAGDDLRIVAVNERKAK
jgi:peptidoglycan hydrolase-like protein with peptidoglycan-binding domain